MASRNLLVKILGDDRDLQRAFASSSRGATQFGTNIERSGAKADKALRNVRGLALGTGAAFAGGFVASEALRQVGAAVDVASNLNEQIARTQVVFAGSSDAITAWSKTTASSIGIAQDQALAAAGTFGAMFEQAGTGAADAAQLSQAVVTLASDLASFNNTNIDDTLTALRSGLSGEIEPLRKLQVFLTEAAVSQQAMIDTGKDHAEQLTQGEKIMARWNLILEQTAKQQGDYARTSDSLANQQRRLSAEIRDLQANAGGVLLPIMTNLTNFAGDATVAVQGLGSALDKLGQTKITPLEIPLNFTIVSDQGGGDLKVADLAKFNIFEVVQLGIDAAMGTGPFGQGEQKGAGEIRVNAKAFDDAFAPFTDSVIEGGKEAAARAGAKMTAAFGDPGFRIVPNDLGATLQRKFDAEMDALDLDLDKAGVTAGIADDLAIVDQIIATVEKRIESEGRTTALLRQLFTAQQERRRIIADNDAQQRRAAQEERDRRRRRAEERARAAQEAREAATEARQERQFRALGLTPEGGELTPGVPNLRKQFEQLSARDDFGDLAPKMAAKVARAGKVLSGAFGKVTEETRAAVAGIFDAARDVLNEESGRDLVPDIRAVNLSDKILAALGFGTETDAIGKLGLDRRRGSQSRTTNTVTAPQPININNMTVVADDPDAFLRQLQKKAGRTTATSRGRFPGKSMGLA